MAPRRLVVAVLFLALSSTCSTTPGVRLDTGQGQSLIHIPRTGDSKPVELGEEEFAKAIAKEVRRMRPPANPEKAARELFDVPPRSGWYRYTQREGIVPLDAPPPASEWAEVAARVTAAIGQTAASFSAKVPTLPGSAQALAAGARMGVKLTGVAQVEAVAVTADAVTIALAPTAVAMTGQGPGGGSKPENQKPQTQEQYKTPKSGVSGKATRYRNGETAHSRTHEGVP